MENEYGYVQFACKRCGAVHILEDAGKIESMSGYACPKCEQNMTGRELAWLKGLYYLKLSRGLRDEPMGKHHRKFECKINLGRHYKQNRTNENGENRTDQGVIV